MASTATVSATSGALTATTTNKTASAGVTDDLVPAAPAAAKGGFLSGKKKKPQIEGKKKEGEKLPQSAPKLSANELERVTEVFKMYETGLREATIYPKDLLVAMKALGLNPTETEIQDLINEVERNGFIYYPAFCRVIMRKLREDDEENFRRELFRTMIGPKKYEDCVAPIYNYSREVLTFEQFRTIMMSLPEYVDDEEVKSMFAHADKDGNGFISYKEFTLMCKVPDQEAIPTAMPMPTSNGTATISSTVASMTSTVVNAVNGAIKGAASSSGPTSNTATSVIGTSAANSNAASNAPVNTVVTVTSTKS